MTKPAEIAVVIGEHRPKDAPAASDETGMDVDKEARHQAVSDLFDAWTAKDVDAGVAALNAFLRCGPQEGEQEPDGDEAAEPEGDEGEKPAAKKSGMYR